MKLIFIGSGSAFAVDDSNFNSNMLLVDPRDDEKLLIDCGSDARHALYKLGYSYRDIQNVYISHLHADHAGGLEWLALSRKFDPRCDKPTLYINGELATNLWQRTLSGGMMTLQLVKATLDTFFQVEKVADGGVFHWCDVEFRTIKTVHVMDQEDLLPSYGLIFTINGTCILITTDTQFIPDEFAKYYQQADIIFHDCETGPVISGVHARFEQLCTLDPAIKAKMWLYHYNPEFLPAAKEHGFLGYVVRGQEFEF